MGGSNAGCVEDADCTMPSTVTGTPGGEICTLARKTCTSACEHTDAAGNCTNYCCPDMTSTTCRSCFTPVDLNSSYKLATNDYVARGGSGFLVLERNTTQVITDISLRQSVVDFLGQQDRCPEAASAGLKNVPCVNPEDPTTPWARHDGRITRVTSQ